MKPSAGDRRQHSSAHGAVTAVVIAFALTSFSACRGADRNDHSSASRTSPAVPRSSPGGADPKTPAAGGGDPILVKTSIDGLAGTGKVVAGSVLGESAFCAHGSVRHERGSPDIGFPALNVFLCSDGQVKIGFGPGPEQMNNSVQTSEWSVLDGSGRFSGMTGSGQMIVQ